MIKIRETFLNYANLAYFIKLIIIMVFVLWLFDRTIGNSSTLTYTVIRLYIDFNKIYSRKNAILF